MRQLIEALLHPDRRPNPLLRLADRFLGIPLVALLGLLPRKGAEIPKIVHSIGILGNAAIGDTVIASAAILDIRAALPDVKLLFFAPGGDCTAICNMIAGLDAVIPIRMSSPAETIRTIRRHGPFDLWLDLGPWPRANAVISFFAPASLRIGFETPGQHRHSVYGRTALHADDVHEVMNYRRLLAAAGIPGSHIPALRQPRTAGSVRRIVMHIRPGGTAAAMKMWPPEHWITLIDSVTARGMPVVLTGSWQDRAYVGDLSTRCQRRASIDNAAGRLSLTETAELLASSVAVVSTDTGIMHLAAALDCRLVALFGATSPRRWGPLNAHARALSSARECSPCVSLGLEKGCGSNRCMVDLTPDAVFRELAILMGWS
jgi:ADP-heptose:LPS heptosyltransferase